VDDFVFHDEFNSWLSVVVWQAETTGPFPKGPFRPIPGEPAAEPPEMLSKFCEIFPQFLAGPHRPAAETRLHPHFYKVIQ
jgi:hypothetical protein